MPYSSQKQRAYFHYLESKGKMPKKTVDEFDEESEGMDLPERAKKMAFGGRIKVDEEGSPMPEFDEYEDEEDGMPHVEGVAYAPFEDSSGAPKRMWHGGRARKYFSGGIVAPEKSERSFEKALRRQYRKGMY